MRLGFFSLGNQQGKTTLAWAAHQKFKKFTVIDGGRSNELTNIIGFDHSCEIADDYLIRCKWGYELLERQAFSLDKLIDAVVDLPSNYLDAQPLIEYCDCLVIPFECNERGLYFADATLNYLDGLQQMELPLLKVAGLVPFCVQGYETPAGLLPTQECQRILDQAFDRRWNWKIERLSFVEEDPSAPLLLAEDELNYASRFNQLMKELGLTL